MKLTPIVPAFNEAGYLPVTLDALEAAAERLHARSDAAVDTVVIDNNSTDATADIARSKGVAVIVEDVDFYRSLERFAKGTGGTVR